MNKLTISILGIALALAAIPQPSSAQGRNTPETARFNTVFGPTGLISVPTAAVTPDRQLQVGANFGKDIQTYGANVGVGENIEVGGTWANFDNSSTNDEAVLGAKISLSTPKYRQFQLGIGGFTGTDDIDGTWYAVVSTDLIKPLSDARDKDAAVRVHLGYGSRAYSDSVIGGAELFLDKNFALVGEYDGEDVNAALRYSDNNNRWKAQVGVLATDLYGGITYAWHF